MTLTADDFGTFHRAVHGFEPFDWQVRLLGEILAKRRWPRTLDLPTASGKTTCMDIALFALALDARRPPAERWCPRRIAMVVDRRVVVDQAAERGRKIARALGLATQRREAGGSREHGGKTDRPSASTEWDVIRRVADALGSLSEAGETGESPLAVFTLRGGIPRDDGWARTPDQPLLIASTIDQLGSRLLMHGYGVSPQMRPVHAGLLGNDVLILLDEVHLSQPFKQTLASLALLRQPFEGSGLPRRFQFVFLSATPGEVDEEPFRLSKEDLARGSALGARLHATKPSVIVKVSGREQLAARVVSEVARLQARHTVVAAVVNRIDTALAVFKALKASKERPEADIILLTGRMRPLDRDEVLARYRPRVAAGLRRRTPDEPKLVVVGTQCIEAGADFDFDAMVTESASFDALRQRFGRVDRLGLHVGNNGNGLAEGVIVHDKDVKEDPIYGSSIARTIKWLEQQSSRRMVDFASRSLLNAPPDLLAPRVAAPTLLPGYLDLWSQTAPEPFAVPEPGLFLHGPRSGPEDVQVIWRADLDETALHEQPSSNLVAAVGVIPPSALEAVSLPFHAARRWLGEAREALEDTGDVELKAGGGPAEPGGRLAVRWRDDDSEVVDGSSIRPGDTLVLPNSYGGIDPYTKCFDPSARAEVPDLAERASMLARGRPLLRLHPRVLAGLDLSFEPDAALARQVLAVSADEFAGWKRPWARSLGRGRRAHVVPWNDDDDGWLVLEGRRLSPRQLTDALADTPERDSVEPGAESMTDDWVSPHAGVEVPLDVHSRDVEDRARAYARRLGLSEELANDLSLAAWLHDIGKADPRFQRLLRGGSEITWYRNAGTVLAKSAMTPRSKAEHYRARIASGYPAGARHEVQSLAMIDATRDQLSRAAHDIDLVLHLVASHHGHCRPFPPPVDDPRPVDVELTKHTSMTFGSTTFPPIASANTLDRLDSPLAGRYWSLVAKYGWLELCWLETILRLADHRASESEEGGN